MSALPTDTKVVTIARIDGRVVPTEQLRKVAIKAKALTTWVTAGRTVAQERGLLCQPLRDQGVDSLAYVLQVRNNATPAVLMLEPGRTH